MNIQFTDSALKHGLSEKDIRQAMNTCFKTKPVRSKSGERAYMALGILDDKVCELMFNVNPFNGYRVFHAMIPARPSFIKEIERKG